MFAHPIIAVIALVPALVLSQAPEFTQQYSQRLGGALDELHRIILQFDEDSRRSGYDRSAALRKMADNSERLIQDQARRMEQTIARETRLREQQETITHGGPFVRLASVVTNFDRALAQRTLETYVPAVPLTPEAWLLVISGFFASYFLIAKLTRTFHRRARALARPA